MAQTPISNASAKRNSRCLSFAWVILIPSKGQRIVRNTVYFRGDNNHLQSGPRIIFTWLSFIVKLEVFLFYFQLDQWAINVIVTFTI